MRELHVVYPYVIAYEVARNRVTVLRVRQGKPPT